MEWQKSVTQNKTETQSEKPDPIGELFEQQATIASGRMHLRSLRQQHVHTETGNERD